ncbi:MAG TPA: hypothetical protein VF165_07825 [Nocardioidaceae bacterium]
MHKSTKIVAAAFVSAVAAAALVASPGSAESLPAAKAAVAIDNLIDLSQTASGTSPTGSAGDTGWVDVLESQIKTSSQKDLLFDVAMQCGIVTDTTVKSSGGTQSSSTARANMAVRVLVDGSPAMPDNSIDATKASADGVVFCDRAQTLSAKFAGLNCTADATTGAVTCADPEELQLVLKSLDASSFNFAKTDVGTGVHTVTVQARAQAGVNFDDDASGGALAGAEAFAGAGSLAIDEVRLVKGANVMVDLQ